MSGAAVRLQTRERAGRLAEAVLKHLDLTPARIGELQTMPFKQLIAAIGPAQKMVGRPAQPLFDRYDFGPVVDGKTLPGHPYDPAATDISADIPVLVGNVKDEMAIYLAPNDKVWQRVLTEDEMRAQVEPVAGAATDRVVELYRNLFPGASPADRLISTLTDSNFRLRSFLLAERKAAQGRAPVWMYSFDWETPVFDGRLKAYHALDVPFVFNTIDAVNATDRGAVAHDLSRRMSATWAAFARAGKPDNAAIPRWPAYTVAERSTMIFNRECRVAQDYGREARLIWKDIARA
jgi:para-nitrobenzyl esterase